jgi:putative DNA primase/helicase
MSERIWFERFPEALTARDQWVLWRYVEREGRPTKVPFQPNGVHARTDDPTTWSSLSAVQAARWACIGHWDAVTYDGVGYVFSAGDPFVGIDLDKCRGEQWAADFVARFATYTEITPSWKGYHLIGQGSLPAGKGRRKGAVEVYDRGRFFTMTGVTYPDAPSTPRPVQEPLDALLAEWQPVPPPPRAPLSGRVPHWRADTVIRRALEAANGDKLRAIWNGANGPFPSDSEADLGLCGLLAFWSDDPAVLDACFRQSGRMRDKWDELHGAQTYGALTIAKALSAGEHYTLRG